VPLLPPLLALLALLVLLPAVARRGAGGRSGAAAAAAACRRRFRHLLLRLLHTTTSHRTRAAYNTQPSDIATRAHQTIPDRRAGFHRRAATDCPERERATKNYTDREKILLGVHRCCSRAGRVTGPDVRSAVDSVSTCVDAFATPSYAVVRATSAYHRSTLSYVIGCRGDDVD